MTLNGVTKRSHYVVAEYKHYTSTRYTLVPTVEAKMQKQGSARYDTRNRSKPKINHEQ
jgi:hypothetical protein